jgi:GntR family transcriptional regulator/MocR family aminotransferase
VFTPDAGACCRAALQTPELAHWLEPVAGTSGLHLAALARSRRNVDALVADARRAGVGVYSLDEYRHGTRTPNGLLFGYGAIDEAAIEDGLQRLRRLLRQR